MAREAEECDALLWLLQAGDEDTCPELHTSVLLTLAAALEHNELEAEAEETYLRLIGDKRCGDTGRFRLNLGNLYFKRRDYAKALKMYRMALDKVKTNTCMAIEQLKVLWYMCRSQSRRGV